MALDGSNQHPLSNHPSFEVESAYDPNGSRIVFTTDRDGPRRLYVMNPDGSHQRPLEASEADGDNPSFSPNGEWITFTSEREGSMAIYIMRAEGTDARRLQALKPGTQASHRMEHNRFSRLGSATGASSTERTYKNPAPSKLIDVVRMADAQVIDPQLCISVYTAIFRIWPPETTRVCQSAGKGDTPSRRTARDPATAHEPNPRRSSVPVVARLRRRQRRERDQWKQASDMTTYVALLRGINVGGRNNLPMRELVQVLLDLDLSAVRTYIQSGNIVFQTDRSDKLLSEQISRAIQTSHGFAPSVMLLTQGEWTSVMAANPYPEAVGEPKTLQVYFLASEPADPDLALLANLKADDERYELKDKIFYLHAPSGIGRSRLAARVERALGLSATARNWRTVTEIAAMTALG
jgi:uncharacterized protein (DUF1697 family)